MPGSEINCTIRAFSIGYDDMKYTNRCHDDSKSQIEKNGSFFKHQG